MSARAARALPLPDPAQLTVPGVSAVTIRERIAARMAAPLHPKKPQKPLDIGLFDEALRDQLDLF